jgi:hypothetical protein
VATGAVIAVALIWKLVNVEKLVKVAPLLVLKRFPKNVAIPVGVMFGLEARQLKVPPPDERTYNQYFVPAFSVRVAVGVKV